MTVYIVIDYDPLDAHVFRARGDNEAKRRFDIEYAGRTRATLHRFDNAPRKAKMTPLAQYADGEFHEVNGR